MSTSYRCATLLLALAQACAPRAETPAPASDSDYLYLWTASADSAAPDFLAVLDVRPDTGRYGALVTTPPVSGRRNGPHHTEHELSADRLLATFDSATGKLALDARFAEAGSAEPGFRMAGREWPHGGSAPGVRTGRCSACRARW